MSSGDRRAANIVEQFDGIFGGLQPFPETELDRVRELVRAGEWAVALENLCTQLYEYDFVVPPTVLASIEQLGEETGVEARYWARLSVGEEQAGG